jgi:PKHD-type hydroxylase
MMLIVDDVLTIEELDEISHRLKQAEFVDGKLTAGIYAKTVKHNQQIQSNTDVAENIQTLVHQALKRNALFQAAVRPKIIRPVLLSRYEVGMEYGWHTDNALMGEQQNEQMDEPNLMRSDVSLTLFLSQPDTYDGGELVIDTDMGEQAFKLAAGSMLVYPSTVLHQVTTVTRGVRFAAVTWIQSLVRQSQEREILFDLDTVRRSLFEKYGKAAEFDLLSKTYANLLRKWVEL